MLDSIYPIGKKGEKAMTTRNQHNQFQQPASKTKRGGKKTITTALNFKGLYLFARLRLCLNSLTTKKQTTKFSSANFQKMFSPSYIILRAQRLEGK